MNGIKYIREKSNFTRNALAEHIGVTRQTVTLWERGVRKPDKKHLRKLSKFYGIEEKWFGEISDEDMLILKNRKMYRHFDEDKEFYSFIPEVDGWAEISISCGELTGMLDERYSDTLKRKKDCIKRVEGFLEYKRNKKVSLSDKTLVAERGMRDIESFIKLMETIQEVGNEGLYLKVPFRYEILTALYAMMIASGQYSTAEIKNMYPMDFMDNYLHIDGEYMDELIEAMTKHWTKTKNREIEQVEEFLNRNMKKNV